MPTEGDIAAIWKQYQENRTDELRNRIAGYYLPLVERIARRLFSCRPLDRRTKTIVDYDDLVVVGSMGLLQAIDTYDQAKQVVFTTYAYKRIHGAMIDELRAIDWVPRKIRQEMKGSDNPKWTMMVSLQAILAHKNFRHEGDLLIRSEKTCLAEWAMYAGETKFLLRRYLGERLASVVIAYYYDHQTMKEIAAERGVCESRVSGLMKEAMEMLRQSMVGRRHEFTR